MKRTIIKWLGLILIAEICSALVIFHPTLNAITAVALGVVILALSTINPIIGLGIIAIEFLIGSKGALFAFGPVSIRIVLFCAFILGWLIWSIRYKTWREWKMYLPGRKKYFLLGALLIYAALVGWFRGNHRFFIPDANAWGAWLLLLPILDVVHHKNIKHLLPAVFAGFIWLPIKTLMVTFLFSHQLTFINSQLYLWIRRTGVGEVTKITDHAYRVFFQSHIYLVIALIFIIAFLLINHSLIRANRRMVALGSLFGAATLISLSRSLWMGLAVAMIMLVMWTKKFIFIILIGFFSFLIIFSITTPFSGSSYDLVGMIHTRASSSDAASISRWQLLPILWQKIKQHPMLGSGFGSTVTYRSADPRIVQQTGGIATTHAFEWGWVSFWIKFGILGIPLMLWLMISLGYRLWKSSQPEWIRFGCVASLIALAVIHFFTPYLDHPLGFFILIMGEALLVETKKQTMV